MHIFFLTLTPSPYIHGFINYLKKDNRYKSVNVFYLQTIINNRPWDSNIKDKEISFLSAVVSVLKSDVYIFMEYRNLRAFLLNFLAFISKKKMFYWAEQTGYQPNGSFSLVRKYLGNIRRVLLLKIFLYRVTNILAIGSIAKKQYTQLINSKVIIMPYPFDYEFFSINSKKIVNNNKKIKNFVYVGEISERKGLDILFCVFKRLRNEKFKLTVVGKRAKNITEVPEWCRHIEFLPYQNILTVLDPSNIFILNSKYDGWGIAIVEAMAAGMVCIGSKKATSVKDLFKDGINGFIINDPNDESEVENVIRKVSSLDNDEFSCISENAKRTVEYLGFKKSANLFFSTISNKYE
jgi:glycosyltransferase involved in cell wall biosynthesis